MNKQSIIPQKVIQIAKAIQSAEQNNQQLIIAQARQWGKTAAKKLANGEQVLPTNLNDNN